MSLNHITLMGRIERGPEFRMTNSGIPNATFSVAVARPPRQEGGPEVNDYIRVIAWRGLAERLRDTASKGDLVTVEGRLTTRSYETNDGQRRKAVEVEASQVERVTGSTGAGSTDGGEPAGAWDAPPADDFSDLVAPPAAPKVAPSPRPAAAPPADLPDLDDEIPF